MDIKHEIKDGNWIWNVTWILDIEWNMDIEYGMTHGCWISLPLWTLDTYPMSPDIQNPSLQEQETEYPHL